MSPGHDPRIAVMGGSLGGLTAGVLLRRAGFEVDGLRALPPSARGPRRRHRPPPGDDPRDLRRHRPPSAPARCGCATSTPTGGSPTTIPAATASPPTPPSTRRCSATSTRPATTSARRSPGSSRTARRCGSSVADGAASDFDLLIAADGIGSTARAALAPEVRPEYAGYVGWRGTVVEGELSPETYAIVADAISYCILPNSHILIYPIPGAGGSTEPGERLINWVWYRNCPAGPGARRAPHRPPGRTPAGRGRGGLGRRAGDRGAPRRGRRRPPRRRSPRWSPAARSPSSRSCSTWQSTAMAYGRVALIGDAAFALRPHVAAGTAKAAEDAWHPHRGARRRGRRRPRGARRLGAGTAGARPARHSSAPARPASARSSRTAGRPATDFPSASTKTATACLRESDNHHRASEKRPRMSTESADYKSEVRDGMRIDWDVPIAMRRRPRPARRRLSARRRRAAPGDPQLRPLRQGACRSRRATRAPGTAWSEQHPDVTAGSTNKYQNWEVVDPEKWVPDGYACVRVDSRGAGRSPGFIDHFSPRETADFDECIEWAGVAAVEQRQGRPQRHLLLRR